MSRVPRKGKRNVFFLSFFPSRFFLFLFLFLFPTRWNAMDTRQRQRRQQQRRAKPSVSRFSESSGAMLDKSWAARRQGTPAAQPVRWRRAPAALQNPPQRAQRVANPPLRPSPPLPLRRPTATRTRRAAFYISAAVVSEVSVTSTALIGKKGSSLASLSVHRATFPFLSLSSNFYYSSIRIYIYVYLYLCSLGFSIHHHTGEELFRRRKKER